MRAPCAHCNSRRRQLRHRSYITGRRYCSARCQRLALRAQQREIGRILRDATPRLPELVIVAAIAFVVAGSFYAHVEIRPRFTPPEGRSLARLDALEAGVPGAKAPAGELLSVEGSGRGLADLR